jgi:tRNA-binding EMAP/Myf-like protein
MCGGPVVGRVEAIEPIPGADLVRRAIVFLGDHTLQLVFGGQRVVEPYCLVPVAPPGCRVARRGAHRSVKMRTRRYRATVSQGMLCSLEELGWVTVGPDEVAIMRKGTPGEVLPSQANLEEWLSDESFARYAGHVMVGHPGVHTLDVVHLGSGVPADPKVPS